MQKNEKDIIRKGELLQLYKHYRNMIVTLLRKSKQNYYDAYFIENQSNMKKTWDGIRNLINISAKKMPPPTNIVYKNNLHTSGKEMAESLNDFFVNIGSNVEAKIPPCKKDLKSYLGKPNDKSIFLKPCTNVEVLSILDNTKCFKSLVPNSIPTNILIEFSALLVNPIVTIINMSLKEGIFPTLNKEANICPIFKKEDKNKCENYRPISHLPNINKIFERVMYTRLENFLNTLDIKYKFQFGFRKGYSTNHALPSIVEQIREAMDKQMITCGVFIDLEKAFDTVNHSILLSKLDHYGIRGVANHWFASYLSDRHQTVSLNGTISTKMPVRCGVPQGSIIGPLLFLIYINDMNLAMRLSITYHFADDTNLLYSCKHIKELRKTINTDLKLLYDWLCANRLSLDAKKTEFLIFRPPRYKILDRVSLNLHDTKLFESSTIKYLGIILDNKLNWKAHIRERSKKLSRAVGLLYKIRYLTPPSVLRSLYFFYI